METIITKASSRDMEDLLDWRMRVLQQVFDLPADADMGALRAANQAYYEQHLEDGSHTACFARDADTHKIVGCGGICYESEMPSPDNPSGSCGYIMNVFVLPGYRKAGVGRKIAQFLISDAKVRNTDKIYLESSDAGRTLYAALGFEDMTGYMKLPAGS